MNEDIPNPIPITHPSVEGPKLTQNDLDEINTALGPLSTGAPQGGDTEPPMDRQEAIQLAMGVLNEAQVPFMLVASLDAPQPAMRFTHGQRYSYNTSDKSTTIKEVLMVKQQILAVVLKQLSIGYNGGLAVFDKVGKPLYVFQDGTVLNTVTGEKRG